MRFGWLAGLVAVVSGAVGRYVRTLSPGGIMKGEERRNKGVPAIFQDPDADGRLADAILVFLGNVPDTSRREENDPAAVAREIARRAAAKAAVTAGTLAMPPGPLGWFTIIPELVAVWRIQAQMVSDVAGVYGKSASLTREHMLYCLFRHTAAQALRDLVVRVGERLLVRRASLDVMQRIARTVGLRVTQRSIGHGIARWLPIAGAVGVGAYAFHDTGQVGATAIKLFENEIVEASG
jgi:hypothetical protein